MATEGKVTVKINADTTEFVKQMRQVGLAIRKMASMFRNPAQVERVLMLELNWPLSLSQVYLNR